jgi:hypothetical protein
MIRKKGCKMGNVEGKKAEILQNILKLVFEKQIKDGFLHGTMELEIKKDRVDILIYSLIDNSLIAKYSLPAKTGETIKLAGCIVSYQLEFKLEN